MAVLGLSSSSQAGLLAEIDRLGTNMLTVEAGQSLTGEAATLPLEAPGRISATGARSAETRRILQPLYGPPDPREPG